MRYPSRPLPSQRPLRWINIIVATAMHAGCIAAPFCFSWSALGVCLFLGWVSCGLGITLGWHRLLTHRSYQTYKPIEYLLTLLGCLAWQMGPIEWVATHRLHHAHTDEDTDPHSPRDHTRTAIGHVGSFLWSHMGWVFFHPPSDPRPAAGDLCRDKAMIAIDRLAWLPGLLLAPVLFVCGERLGGEGQGLSWLVWGIFVRTTIMYHATWFVNSASHVWGYRNFDTDDDSTNLWWVALISFGEGWHNNHHAQQRSAAHGMRRFEIDTTYWAICLMGRLGLAWQIVRPVRPALGAAPPAAPVGTPSGIESGKTVGHALSRPPV